MAEEYYGPDAKRNLMDWEENIIAARKLREEFPPQILSYTAEAVHNGFFDYCSSCGFKIYVPFGDYSKPLEEKYVPCPNSNKAGHGVWASAINMVLN